MKKIYVCPKCGSEDIRVPDIKSLGFLRNQDYYLCAKCGYSGIFFIKEKIEGPKKSQEK